MSRALLIVDVQNDFCPGGALACEDGNKVAALIGAWQREHAADYAVQIATQDWHIDPGDHFSEEPDFVDSWPPHCVVGTGGAELHSDIATELIDVAVRKGQYSAAYSGFEGSADEESLAALLQRHEITDLDIVGIATDYCVRATVLDARNHGYAVRVYPELCAGVAAATSAAALQAMQDAGARLVELP
ncbi:isochorismatase family protein [Corynebacterium choanae]|uniref:nicotinamidase n=1 Tax=Corynebacterium choanae TaxID=1862358 RepID=A0A3G6J8N0_9CORY|nr:isochorismatase family protein [Corynebacterium choanae]AZA14162.1 nicotinamidase/pyrazinamidase [Corynebacterium choanae]